MADQPDGLDRAWGVLSRWAVPVMMALAYALLAATSDTDTSGKAWMMGGLALVLIVWFAFRALTDAAALSRALGVGDTARLLARADRELARRRRPADRARFLVARGLAHLLRGEHAEARAALDAAEPAGEIAPLAAALRVIARVEADPDAASAGGVELAAATATAGGPRAPWLGWLADAALAWRAGRLADAAALAARVTGEVRAGSAVRAIAHVYAARIAEAGGDPGGAARHRAAAAELAAPDAAWLRGEPAAVTR